MVVIMFEYYIGVVKGFIIVFIYDDMFDILSGMKKILNFVGFIIGLSCIVDIECVGIVGVYGLIDVFIVIVDDE